jgi:hypothetical protein
MAIEEELTKGCGVREASGAERALETSRNLEGDVGG